MGNSMGMGMGMRVLTLGASRFWSANSRQAMRVNVAQVHRRWASEKGCWKTALGMVPALCITREMEVAGQNRAAVRRARERVIT